ncbi:MAG: c-type cytochrome [Marinosulfonomonas sp.]|nr:c-type cytochrome [Marinosulfonomonas sp.]
MLRTIGLFALTALFAAPLAAQDAGSELFAKYCATCHGLDATGNGPMSPNLILQPTDLTGLAAANDGAFPTLRVVKRIDGREPLVSHGSPMPVFGDFFEGRGAALKTASGQPIMTSQPIVELVTWLESLQK